MKQITYNPFAPLGSLNVEHLIDDLSGRSLGQILGSEWTNKTPAINIIEEEQSYLIQLAAPGLAKSDFDVAIEDDNLVISVNKEAPEASKAKQLTKEFDYDHFTRKFYLSEDINREEVDAIYELGVLTVTLSKKIDKEEKVRTIKIV